MSASKSFRPSTYYVIAAAPGVWLYGMRHVSRAAMPSAPGIAAVRDFVAPIAADGAAASTAFRLARLSIYALIERRLALCRILGEFLLFQPMISVEHS